MLSDSELFALLNFVWLYSCILSVRAIKGQTKLIQDWRAWCLQPTLSIGASIEASRISASTSAVIQVS